MHVHPSIAQLRGNWASQHRIQARLARETATWLDTDRTRSVTAALESYARGAELSDCAALRETMTDAAGATEWVQSLLGPLMDSLAEEPLGVVPLQSRQSESHATIQLMSCGTATLNLTTYRRSHRAVSPETVLQVDRESRELLLRGSARGWLHEIPPGDAQNTRIASQQRFWQAGDRIDLRRETVRQLTEIKDTLLVLQLYRSATHPRSTREFRLSDGRLNKSASGDKRASRDMLALAVLGTAEHRPAIETMERMAKDPERDIDLRWEAQRQLLALDTGRGVRVLRCLAESETDPLADAAQSLHAQLLASHPQLVDLAMEAT